MKRLALITIMALSAGMSFATAAPSPVSVVIASSKTEVAFDQLPDQVRKTLDGAKFTGWKPVIAYKVVTGTSEYFEITFVRGDEIEQLLLNSQGGKIG